jgi:hypothetical protein
MKTRQVTIHDIDNNSVQSNLWGCEECGNEEWVIYKVEGQDHPHIQCTMCSTSYCPGGCQTDHTGHTPDTATQERGEGLEEVESEYDGTYPHSLNELIAYLTSHPKVECQFPGRESASEKFIRYAKGGLWFERADRSESYVPIDCAMTPSETGLKFNEHGFTVTKFSISIEFTYEE